MRQLADAQGNIVQRYDYNPFGEVVAAQGTRASKLQYTGEQNDIDTGLIYLRARWYDPATGRFTSRDPFRGIAGLPQSQHPYVYALNNPINLIDPSGEAVTPETLWDLGVVAMDMFIMFLDAINPCLTAQQRADYLAWDRIALSADILAALTPFAPGGSGLAGRGALAIAEVTVRVPAALRGVQVGTHLAQASRSGSSGGGRKEGHHPWPQYLTGRKQQDLYKLQPDLHHLYHAQLDDYLPRRLGSDFYRKLLNTPQKVNEFLDALLEFNRYFDSTHRTHTFEALEDELRNVGLLPRP